ncbi:MAG: hypothetical protein WCB55_24950, partial [Pseudolabrys sp.]
PGIRSSINPGKSCPSLAAIGQSPVNHCEGWYNSSSGPTWKIGSANRHPYLYMAAHRALTARNMPPLALRAEYR